MLDTVREAHTPEGVALRLPAAGPFPRAVAWLIDATIRVTGLVAAAAVLGLMGEAGSGLYLVLLFLALWIYPVLFEVLRNGQTPGKRAMNLQVIRDDGAPVGWQASLVRNLLRAVDMLPVGYAVGLTTALFDPAGRRLGDMVGGTLVIHVPERLPRKPAGRSHGNGKSAAAPLVEAVPLQGVVLLPYEQAAVVAFSERAPTLTPERQAELAGLAGEVAGEGVGPGGAVARLHGIAAHLLGRAQER